MIIEWFIAPRTLRHRWKHSNVTNTRCSTRERHARYVDGSPLGCEHQKSWQNNLVTMDAAVLAGNNRRCSGEY